MAKAKSGVYPYTSFVAVTRTSVNTPNFKRLKLSGGALPMNAHLYYWCEGTDPQKPTYNGMRNTYQAGWSSQAFPKTQIDSGAAGPSWNSNFDLISNRLAKGIRSVDVDLGAALGELPETASLITSTMSRLGKAALAARRRDPVGVVRHLFGTRAAKRIKDVPKDASSAWLGYSYGVKPLVSDVYAAVNAYENGLKVPKRNRIRSSLPVSYSYSGYASGVPHYPEKVVGSGTASGSIFYEVASPVWASLASLGLTNPASIAWELTPLSFVVDWFIPIGDFIASLTPPAGLAFKRGHVYQKVSGSGYRSVNISGDPGYKTRCDFSYAYKERRALSTFPRFQLTLDTVSLDLNKGQVASGIALLIQRVLK